MNPRVAYDAEARVYTVYIEEGEIQGTREHGGALLIDVDASGRALSVEVLDASAVITPDVAERYGFADKLPAVTDAVKRAMFQNQARTASSAVYKAFSAKAMSWMPVKSQTTGAVSAQPSRELV